MSLEKRGRVRDVEKKRLASYKAARRCQYAIVGRLLVQALQERAEQVLVEGQRTTQATLFADAGKLAGRT